MTCRQLDQFLMDYVAGTLPENIRGRFDEHLGECPDCRVYLDTYRSAVSAGKAAYADDNQPGDQPIPDALIQAVIKAARLDA